MNQKLQVKLDGLMHTFQVEKVFESPSLEKFKVYGANKEIVLQTNRRVFKAKGLKYREGQWKVVEGKLGNQAALEAITEAIEKLADPA